MFTLYTVYCIFTLNCIFVYFKLYDMFTLSEARSPFEKWCARNTRKLDYFAK